MIIEIELWEFGMLYICAGLTFGIILKAWQLFGGKK